MRYLFLFLAMLLFGCSKKTTERPRITASTTIHYLALGDSYTIGESVPAQNRFPQQLADSLKNEGFKIEDPSIIARTGWTTNDLEAAIADAYISGDTFELVTLLIGVNNQYRGYPIDDYGPAFQALLEKAIRFAGNRRDRVFVVSIPDYAVTDFGQQRPNPEQISTEIDAYNETNRNIAASFGITYFDITPISRKALKDPSLVADDRLHPSGKMYTQWVDLMLPEIVAALR